METILILVLATIVVLSSLGALIYRKDWKLMLIAVTYLCALILGVVTVFLSPQKTEFLIVENLPESESESKPVRQQFGWSAYREGAVIYTTYYSETEPEIIFTNIDVATFQSEVQLTQQRSYSPVADGGFSPHWYTDKNFLYCGIGGKGVPDPVQIPQPVELLFTQLEIPFDPSDGFNNQEQSAWQEQSTGDYGQLYWRQTETLQLYNAIDCSASTKNKVIQ